MKVKNLLDFIVSAASGNGTSGTHDIRYESNTTRTKTIYRG